MGKNYGLKQFKLELKAAMQTAGVEGEQVFLLIEDHNLIDVQFLDLINSLLSSGEVPGLYTPEELEPIITPLREMANNDGYSGDLYSYYAQSVLKNLHIILIMDCKRNTFSINCDSNPAIYKKCSVQWNETWSPDTLSKMPILMLKKHEKEHNENLDNGKETVEFTKDKQFAQNFHLIHTSVPPKNAPPKKFFNLVKTYISVYGTKKEKVQTRRKKLAAGVSKLNEAREVVSRLKEEAAVQEKQLAEKQGEANQALQMITDTMRNANTQKTEMQDLKGKTIQEERAIAERKRHIDAELAEIEPLIAEAKKAVGNIKNETLTEVRALRVPPEVIRDILEATLVLMGIQDTSWNSMKTFLGKRGIKEEIKSFDARRISSKSRAHVEKLLEEKSSSFSVAAAKRASTAAVPLAQWVMANVKYSYVLEKIKPLEDEQNNLRQNLKMAEDQLTDLTQGLDEVDKKVAVLKEKLNQATREAAEVELSLGKTKEIITSADKLVAGLEGEYHRWKKEVESMGSDIEMLPVFALLASAFLTYLSDQPEDVRSDHMTNWQGKLGVKRFDMKHFLSSEQEMLEWRSEGLPLDELSMENAITMMKCVTTPFLIDPASQATEWLKTHAAKHENVEVTTLTDDRFFLTLELAVRFGKTLIIQEVDRIEPSLYALLRGDIIGQGPYKVVQIGEKQVDCNPSFKLYMTSRMISSEVESEADSVVSLINFTTTRAGLTSQLLAQALQHEKPELEERKSDLLKQEEELKIQISRVEDELLNQLANATGNILENKDLLNSLNETKTKSATIEASLSESVALQEKLEEEGNVYLPLAEFASTYYFVIRDLSKINNMYRYSLSSFMKLFKRALKIAPSGSARIDNLKKCLQGITFEYISKSMFKTDRLMLAMHVVHGMCPDLFMQDEWDLFIGILIDGENAEGRGQSIPGWVSEERRDDVSKLVSSFPNLEQALQLEDASVWSTFIKAENCEEQFPLQVSKKLSLFQQLLVIQALRPDRLQTGMEFFAQRALGLKEISLPPLNLKTVCSEAAANEPILLIIPSGSDPSQELRDLAAKTRQTLHEVAMGQGQTVTAIEKLRESMRHGQWLCLKNLHLMTFWIPELAKEFQLVEPHEDFRLWLTAESHPKFPAIMLESSLKVTYESPPGIKKNLQTTLNSWTPEFVARGGNSNRSQTLFVLAWFHAVIQERRTYIPQGWAKYYEFSDSDLRAGLEAVESLFKNSRDDVSWDFVHGLFENAIYGGRVDDTHDIRILNSYLQEYFSSNVIGGTSRARKSLGPGIELPTSASYQDLTGLVQRLPDDDRPQFFGLPANIERSHQRSVSKNVIGQLKAVMRPLEISSRFDREKWQSELSLMLNLWKKLNQGSGVLQQKNELPNSQESNPVKAFIQMEYYTAVNLVQAVHKSLAGLSKVKGGLYNFRLVLLAN